VAPERELSFLHPLEVERLWGVGPVTAQNLRDRGITTVGQVAELDETALVLMLGRAAGRHIHALAHNRDPRRVRLRRRRRSIGAQRALGRKPRTWDELDAIVVGLIDRLTRRFRTARRAYRGTRPDARRHRAHESRGRRRHAALTAVRAPACAGRDARRAA
jgi:DNA polymerase-4